MTHPERVYSREQLLNHVWGTNVYVEDRTVDVHIRRLRKALERAGMTAWCRPCAVQDIVFNPLLTPCSSDAEQGL